MEILHVSAECYPIAKVGGLADVVGSLPKFQQELGHISKVVLPMHRTKFLYNNEWEVVHKGTFSMGLRSLDFTIIKEKTNKLGFDLYCVDIIGLLDREKVYGYDDDTDRYLAFQIAVAEWLNKWQDKPDILHLHDHQTSLLPFMLRNCFVYSNLSGIKTILTIHNGEYQGWMSWDKVALLPAWDTWKWGLLDWNNNANSLACGIKCADRVTTVSPGYLEELKTSNSLRQLIINEDGKCIGIINGIDYYVWNPVDDSNLNHNYNEKNFRQGKQINKDSLCEELGFNAQFPLFIFIGRFVNEKAADLLPAAISLAMQQHPDFNFLVLGSGEKSIESDLLNMIPSWPQRYDCKVEYNESLSHRMYAGADFLLMPSRVEPCGLNQLYAMRYATNPVVRSTGG